MKGEFLSIETAERLAKLERDNKSLTGSNKRLYKKVQEQKQQLIYKDKKIDKLKKILQGSDE